jgi:tRNA/tmRNA/rRNA uracil-C5-methylase (TrmA/RlmC/RlmD family)
MRCRKENTCAHMCVSSENCSHIISPRVTMQLPRKDLYIFLAFFYQAFDALLQKLQKYVPYESSVTDLYAGAGVIGLSLAATRKCR